MANDDAEWMKTRQDVFRIQWIRICKIFIWISALAELVVIIAEIIIMSTTISNYTYYLGQGNAPSRGYEKHDHSSVSCGFVAYTNAPKHLGSIYFAAVSETSIIIWCLLCMAADVIFLYSSYNNYGNATLRAFFMQGTSEGEKQAEKGSIIPPYFIVANGFLKLYIVAVYEAQSFVGISYGADAPGGSGPNGNRFCLWAGFILLGSILPSIVSQVFVRYKRVQDGKYYENKG